MEKTNKFSGRLAIAFYIGSILLNLWAFGQVEKTSTNIINFIVMVSAALISTFIITMGFKKYN